MNNEEILYELLRITQWRTRMRLCVSKEDKNHGVKQRKEFLENHAIIATEIFLIHLLSLLHLKTPSGSKN